MEESYIIAIVGVAGGLICAFVSYKLHSKYKNKDKLELTSDETIINSKDIEHIEHKLDELKAEVKYLCEENKAAIINANVKIVRLDELIRKLDSTVSYLKGIMRK